MPAVFENRFFSVAIEDKKEEGGAGQRELVITHKVGGGKIYLASKRSGQLVLTTNVGALLDVSMTLGDDGEQMPTITMRVVDG